MILACGCQGAAVARRVPGGRRRPIICRFLRGGCPVCGAAGPWFAVGLGVGEVAGGCSRCLEADLIRVLWKHLPSNLAGSN